MTDHAPEPFITVASAATTTEAHAIAALLESEDIEARVIDSAETGAGVPLSPGANAVPVQVIERDAPRAEALLADKPLAHTANEDDPADHDDDAAWPEPTPRPMPPLAKVAFIATAIMTLLLLITMLLVLVVG